MWWDFVRNDGAILGVIPGGFVVGVLGSVFLLYLYLQMTAGDVFLEVGYLLGTLLFVPGFIVGFAYAYDGIGDVCSPDTPYECLYFSVVTFTTLGYGDVLPPSEGAGRLYASLQALLGFLVVPVLIAQMVNLVKDVKALD